MKKLLGFLCCVLLMVGCDKQKEASLENRQIRVVSTTGMIHDVVVNIGGDRIDGVSLMGPGIDPHLYRASEGDVSRLSRADIIFYNGLHLEAKMGEILEKMSETKKTVAVTRSVPPSLLLPSPDYEGLYDPHVWFDVSIWMMVAEEILKSFIDLDPKHAAYYEKQAMAYLKKLQALQTEVISKTSEVPKSQRILVTAHDAFNYFGKAYGFQVKGLQGISTESKAGVEDVQKLALYIADHQLPAMFVESSVPKRNIEAVQAAVKAKGFSVSIGGELFSDAMGDAGTIEGTYIGMVEHNVDTIVNALLGQQKEKK